MSAEPFDGERILATALALEAEARERVAALRRRAQERAKSAVLIPTLAPSVLEPPLVEIEMDEVEVVAPAPKRAAPPPVPAAQVTAAPRRVAIPVLPKFARTEPGSRPRLPGLPPTRPPINQPMSPSDSATARLVFDAFAAFSKTDET